MTQVYSHRVRYHEADAQGILFNSRYLELADIALTEYFRALGWPYGELVAGGTDPSVVRAEVTFVKPARFDDIVDVDVRCVGVGISSFKLEMTMTRDGEVVATTAMTYVNVDPATATSRPLPEEVADALRARTGDGWARPGAKRVD